MDEQEPAFIPGIDQQRKVIITIALQDIGETIAGHAVWCWDCKNGTPCEPLRGLVADWNKFARAINSAGIVPPVEELSCG